MTAEVRQGLSRVLADTPVRGGFLEAQAGVGWSGPYLRAEAGHRLAPSVGLFGFAQWERPGGMAGLGARVTW